MNKTRQLFVSAVVIAALAQLLPMMGVRSIWLGSLLVVSNLLVCVLGYRTGNYRTYWLSWGLLTVVAFVMFGLRNPVSMLRLGLAILFAT
jgi:hypothetical protein